MHYNYLEEYIFRLYQSIDVFSPRSLDEETISGRLGIVVHYIPFPSMVSDGMIFIDSRKSLQGQWQSFGHELCHLLMHAGDQLHMPPPFRIYQEWKANNFASNFCIPSFMLECVELPNNRAEAIKTISDIFNVEDYFAENRLDQWLRKRQAELYSQQIAEMAAVYERGR